MFSDAGGGFSGQSYDKHVFEENLSTVNKLQREYWTAKQVFKKKFGKEQDQHVIASDSEIDAKLRVSLLYLCSNRLPCSSTCTYKIIVCIKIMCLFHSDKLIS